MGEVSLASIGVADDIALLSPSPHALQSLLNISQALTSSKCMVNVPEKTKMLAYAPKHDVSVAYWKETAPISMAGASLPLSPQAEHVGILRSSSGSNLLSVTTRIASHTRSLYSIISCGLARNPRGNPAASLRVESCYSSPKLFSGLASLCLNQSELDILSLHCRTTLQRLQRLHPRTPAPAVHLLSGSLPAAGQLHQHQFTLLHMVASLGPDNILHRHGLYMLHQQVPNSWFVKLRQVSTQYSLPDPLQVLSSPLPKSKFKYMVKTAIRSYWSTKLVAQATQPPQPPVPPLPLPPSGLWTPSFMVDLPILP